MDMVESGTVGRPLKLGKCLVCGDRVFKNQSYIEAEEGHAHRGCAMEVADGEA